MPPAIVPFEDVAVERLIPHPANPRRGNVDAVAESIRANGFYGALVVQRSTRHVLAGNHRLQAARQLGMATVPVVWVDCDDDRALRILVADNKSSDLATWDDRALADLLRDLDGDDLTGTLFDQAELDALLRDLEVPNTDADHVPEAPPTNPLTERGDVWELGPHRLVCGDATVAADVDRLLEGEGTAAMAFTDPPFAIYGSSSGISAEVADDKMVRSFFRDILVALSSNVRLFGHVYICCDWRSWASWWEVARGSHLAPKNMIVWDKSSVGLGGMYANTHELLFFASRQPSRSKAMTSGKVSGERMVNDSNVWKAARVPGGPGRLHNAQKPVELIERAMANSSDPGDVVLDLFGGSGSTLIAAADTGRRARVLDVDPKWCDVICTRFEEHTGTVPLRDGQPVSFLA